MDLAELKRAASTMWGLAGWGRTEEEGLSVEWHEADAERRFAGLARTLDCEERAATFRFPSLEACRECFRTSTGGEVILRSMLPPDRYAAFDREATRPAEAFAGVEDGGVVLRNAYLRVLAGKR